ncbi:MAG: retropepsin-like domain-containing protein [Lachnospiraceae bacterium]|nr:retropepsin-like domain-containing protein [Lachnospiraceae bacterium]
MYSTNIKDNRYLVRCLAVANEISVNNFVVDTGAKITCCNSDFMDENILEKDVAKCEVKLLGGLVKGNVVKFYRYPLKQFTIGNINMGEQDIWITFDKRVTDIILGMDILKQIIMITNPYNQKIYFCKDAEDYEQCFQLKVG